VLPLVPGYLGYIGGAVQPRVRDDAAADTGMPGRRRLLLGVLLFIAGFTVVFVSMTILGGTVGQFLQLYSDLITRILGVVVIALGLVFIGLFGFAQRTVHPQVRSEVGLIGAPLLGLALGIGWTPCIGPTLGAIMALSWNAADPLRGALLGLAYSLGLGIPFVLIALGFGWATRSLTFLRRHIRAVNLIGGALLVALGVLMVTGVWSAFMSQLQGVIGSVPLPL
jgi:cytochrome c-type biogenesis protein